MLFSNFESDMHIQYQRTKDKISTQKLQCAELRVINWRYIMSTISIRHSRLLNNNIRMIMCVIGKKSELKG